MSVVFLDTVGLIALWDNSDQWHELAEQSYRTLRNSRRRFISTSYVLLECGNAASRRPYRYDVARLMKQLNSDNALIRPENSDWNSAWYEFELGHPGSAGIVDCVSFAVMRRLGIVEAYTNDQHFRDAGFATLF